VKHDRSLIVIYILIVLVFAFGVKQSHDASEQANRAAGAAHALAVQASASSALAATKFCDVSIERWELFDLMIETNARPITPVQGQETDAAYLARVNARNKQLAENRNAQLAKLGPKPEQC
jgi:hypothetical protein